jgi:hypothetical protein
MRTAGKGLETEEGESEASEVGGAAGVTRGTDHVMVRWSRVRSPAEAMERWAAVSRGGYPGRYCWVLLLPEQYRHFLPVY